MPKIKTSFKGLAKSLYPEPDVFIRKLIQNAHDSIMLRKIDAPHLSGKIEVFTDPASQSITFEDNGMDKTEIEEFLSTIGNTDTKKEALARRDIIIDTIAQFGIGLLSAFVVERGVHPKMESF